MTPTSDAHRALVVDPDPAARDLLGEALAALGHHVRFARSVDEALAALDEEDFCLLAVDPRLPSRDGARALDGGGERVLTSLRKLDSRRDASDFHRTPVLVTTETTDLEHVARMYELGASAVLAKPLAKRVTLFRDKVQACLARGGRADHAKCAQYGLIALRARAAKAAVRVSIDGAAKRRLNDVLINDARRRLQDNRFAVFVKLVAFHVRTPAVWSSREALGVVRSREALSRIRTEFRGLIPAGFEVIEGDGKRRFRLNPAIVVEHVAWDTLAEHGSFDVRKVAREVLERATRAQNATRNRAT